MQKLTEQLYRGRHRRLHLLPIATLCRYQPHLLRWFAGRLRGPRVSGVRGAAGLRCWTTCRESSTPKSWALGMRSFLPASRLLTLGLEKAPGLALRIASIIRWILIDGSGLSCRAIADKVSPNATAHIGFTAGARRDGDTVGAGDGGNAAAGTPLPASEPGPFNTVGGRVDFQDGEFPHQPPLGPVELDEKMSTSSRIGRVEVTLTTRRPSSRACMENRKSPSSAKRSMPAWVKACGDARSMARLVNSSPPTDISSISASSG